MEVELNSHLLFKLVHVSFVIDIPFKLEGTSRKIIKLFKDLNSIEKGGSIRLRWHILLVVVRTEAPIVSVGLSLFFSL